MFHASRFPGPAILLFAIGCSGSGGGATPTAPSSPPVTATTYQGTVADTGNEGGSLTVTIEGAAASAVLRLPGGTTNLTGSADAANNVSLAGGGFSFTGSVADGVLGGTYTGPGSTQGGFSALNATSATVTRYCGAYFTQAQLQNGGSYTESGTFTIQASSNGTVTGTAATRAPTPACCERLNGRISGNTITMTTSGGGTGTATISGTNLSGTGSVPSGNGRVTFTGSSQACP